MGVKNQGYSKISLILFSFKWVWNDKKSYREADGSNYSFDPSASLYDSHHEIEWLSNDSEWIWNDRIR